MADNDSDSSEKTEEPTHRRLDEARKKGNVAYSREVTNFLMLLLLAFTILLIAPWVMKGSSIELSSFIQRPHDFSVDPLSIQALFLEISSSFLLYFVLPIGGAVIIAFIAGILQNGFLFSTESLNPDLEKLSPLKGLKRLFSLKSVVEFLKGIFKLTVVAVIVYVVVEPHLKELETLPAFEMPELMTFIATLSFRVAAGVVIAMFVIAIADYLYQRYEYIKNLKMSKQELKEEYKQTEGSPEVKNKLRQLRRERARQRMMQAVPKADVVIRNPTHFAVALQYDSKAMAAPVVVAKGQDHIALQIIKIAEEHKVPLVRNPPLARVLFDTVELDEPVPTQHYKAVAEVIGYVYKLKGKVKRPAS